ncbi:MAG: glycine cleavage system aminomethyltransferase GcvT [Thermoproteota archaeon]|nr:MAG: glycine cleavage system aminomethyltransferase GcvT [Candidatus Korarchaeota archaeon]RLG55488.1 MAG: glycine cleavage system aminomethyltransferase GcvT [Candidatus Korarchaeota archaeon]
MKKVLKEAGWLSLKLDKTPLYSLHQELGAKMFEFAGWSMPLRYTKVTEEVLAVRNSYGLFDVSHMGRFFIEGEGALELMQMSTTNDVSKLQPLKGHYTFITNEKGGFKDDCILTCMGKDKYFLVVNAANRVKIGEWLAKVAADMDLSVQITDITFSSASIAVQGPLAPRAVEKASGLNLSNVSRFSAVWMEISGIKVFATRTGYTGEDGFELYVFNVSAEEPENAVEVFKKMLEIGEAVKAKPCGLAARDVLRLEAGFVLYGNDVDEGITPVEADLMRFVKLDKGSFIGREAIETQLARGISRKRIGIKMITPHIPRKGNRVMVGGEEVGFVTSGNHSPTVGTGIAMGYLKPEYARPGVKVEVETRAGVGEALTTSPPFYDTSVYGLRRSTKPEARL